MKSLLEILLVILSEMMNVYIYIYNNTNNLICLKGLVIKCQYILKLDKL